MKPRSLPDFPGYLIYPGGSVRSRGRNAQGRKLKAWVNVRGYLTVKLYKPGGKRSRTIPVHRLVATAFIPNPHQLPQVNHKDGRKPNNRRGNLEWTTNENNLRHSWKIGTHRATNGNAGKLWYDETISEEVKQLRASGLRLKDIARQLGLDWWTVRYLLKRA